MTESTAGHTPVLPAEVIEWLAPHADEVVLDATVGLGGHARLLADAVGPEGRLYGLDVDATVLASAELYLADAPCSVELARRNFTELDAALADFGVEAVDIMLADLGVSSVQLDTPERGFSFRHDGALDMRMDDRLCRQAGDLVNCLGESELADLIYRYADERLSRRIAWRICQARREARITTTRRLADLVCQAVGGRGGSRRSRIHPATRTFQALRIAVNDELGALAKLLESAPRYLRPGGRLGVISFHSLEDRTVKQDFRRRQTQGLYEILTKRPIVAGAVERRANPRSRSAKLRVARRTDRAGEPPGS